MTTTDRAPTAEPFYTHPSRATMIDAAHVAWSAHGPSYRPTFGVFAVNYLRNHGLHLLAADERPTVRDVAADLGMPDDPNIAQALALGVEQVADLLAALAERGLRWIPGQNGECGTLLEGQSEPPDLHAVFNAFGLVWQRDDSRAHSEGGDPCERWFAVPDRRATWSELQRDLGPLTPDGGIAPPARDEPDQPGDPADTAEVGDDLGAAWGDAQASPLCFDEAPATGVPCMRTKRHGGRHLSTNFGRVVSTWGRP